MILKEKKGQVTFFIILGIIIVIFTLIIFYLRGQVDLSEYVAKGVVVPEQAKGFTYYVENCITELAVEALDLMGANGGYVIVPDYLSRNPMMSLEFDDFTSIPYWIYINGEDIPEREFLEEQIDDYVENNFEDRCGFDEFSNQGYKIFYEDIKTDVKINDENIKIKLDSGLDVDVKGSRFVISDYVNVYIDNEIGKMHKMAKKIAEKELRDGALEFNTMNLVAVYSREDPNKIPPLAGVEFKCGKRVWLKPTVKNHLKQIFVENIPHLRILNTKYVPYEDIFYDSMTWDVFSENYENVAVNFNYFDVWPLSLDVFPSKGAIIRSDSFDTIAPFLFLCTNLYHFVYDISYPVIVTLVNDKGYMFRFPILVDVRDNYARKRFLGDIIKDVEVQSLFCDLNQRLSEDVEITAYNINTGRNLGGVRVLYLCADEACDIGDTDESGRLRAKFPFCVDGEINFVKDGYLTDRQKISITPESVGIILSANLEQIKEIKVSAKIFDTEKEAIDPTAIENLDENARIIGSKERVIVQLNKRSTYNIDDYDYQTAFVVERNEKEIIDLVPGSYDVQVMLMTDEVVVIPEKNYKTGIWPFQKTVTIPEIKIEDGIILGTIEYNFNIYVNDLDKEIEFYALSRGIPKDYDDLEKIFDVQANSDEYGISLIPRFK